MGSPLTCSRPFAPQGCGFDVPTRWRRAALATGLSALLLGLGACGSGGTHIGAEPTDGAGQDALLPDWLRGDGAGFLDGLLAPDATDSFGDSVLPGSDVAPGSFGAACVDNGDCASGWCVPWDEGNVCTRTCVEDCPTGWQCRAVTNTWPDATFVCFPDQSHLCEPCSQDRQCGNGYCLEVTDGFGCGRACRDDSECPADYRCEPRTSREDALRQGSQCVPRSGRCDCLLRNDNEERPCSRENAYGRCWGIEICEALKGWTDCSAGEAAPEACDGRDNDCNGLADDQLVPPEPDGCRNENEAGVCTGSWLCQGTEGWLCTAGVPAPDDCDYRDNDCDGFTDEDFRDPETGVYNALHHCGVCGYSCEGALPHATARCAAESEGATACAVERCETGYYLAGPTACLPLADATCQPCRADEDCLVPGNRCLEIDDGHYCARDCSADNLYGTPPDWCPEGYQCTDLGPGPQCVPQTGACTCRRPEDEGSRRPCARSGPAGTCTGLQVCQADLGWSACDAREPDSEICDGVDNDCDGPFDEDIAPPANPCQVANDFGTCRADWRCEGPAGWLCPAATPGPEACDFADNDCDGQTDEDFRDGATGLYADYAHCGVCNNSCENAIPFATETACEVLGDAAVCVALACEPDYYIPPGMNRVCLPIAGASDCSPCASDEHCDTLPGGLCDEVDGARFCTRSCLNDDDCPLAYTCPSGRCLPQSLSCRCLPPNAGDLRVCFATNEHGTCTGTQTCNPNDSPGWSDCNAAVPTAELCNGVDDNCNLLSDEGVAHDPPDCAVTNPWGQCGGRWLCQGGAGWVCTAATPAAEACDYIDNDCDGATDETFADLYDPCTAGTGQCQRFGFYECTPGGTGTACNAVAGPAATEACDGLDNDCDTLTDETWPNLGQVCTVGAGVCLRTGVWACAPGGQGVRCTATAGTPDPAGETCDGLDNDCDTSTDEGVAAPRCDLTLGVCAGAVKRCGGPLGWLPCTTAEYGAQYEPTEISCDGRDNDCDGAIDESLTPPACALQSGVCAGSRKTCGGSAGWQNCTAATYTAHNPDYEFVETSCDVLDNDCDGQTDEGWQHGGVYDGDYACGNCFTDCAVIYDRPNAYGRCDTTSAAPTCVMTCCTDDSTHASCTEPLDYFDLNAVPADGCEFPLDPDTVYVSVSDPHANDLAGCGIGPWPTDPQGRHWPCRSIAAGLTAAASLNRSRILVAAGAYRETVRLVAGRRLYGGYHPTTWVRDAAANLTALFGNTMTGHRKTVIADNLTTGSTVLDGFTIYGENASTGGLNAYAVYVARSNDTLQIVNNVIWSGNGAPGGEGSSGANGDNGPDGAGGQNAYEPAAGYDCYADCVGHGAERPGGGGGQRVCGATNVSGGSGGLADCPDFHETIDQCDDCADESLQTVTTSGLNAPNGGGAGGLGGCDSQADRHCRDLCICYNPSCPQQRYASPGSNGGDGVNGAGGVGCAATFAGGTVLSHEWAGLPGESGGNGAHGRGGGGGGAGGGVETHNHSNCSNDGGSDIGGSGGGGGAGGCAGTGGGGGASGGGSFALFVSFATPPGTRIPVLNGNVLHRGFGGTGGSGGPGGSGGGGGSGGAGGQGGVGGTSYYCAGPGAKGGEGGDGGHGGGGGGACGGVSYGIYAYGQGSANLNAWRAPNNTFAAGGAAGVGGRGGGSGNGGQQGQVGATGAAGDTNF